MHKVRTQSAACCPLSHMMQRLQHWRLLQGWSIVHVEGMLCSRKFAHCCLSLVHVLLLVTSPMTYADAAVSHMGALMGPNGGQLSILAWPSLPAQLTAAQSHQQGTSSHQVGNTAMQWQVGVEPVQSVMLCDAVAAICQTCSCTACYVQCKVLRDFNKSYLSGPNITHESYTSLLAAARHFFCHTGCSTFIVNFSTAIVC